MHGEREVSMICISLENGHGGTVYVVLKSTSGFNISCGYVINIDHKTIFAIEAVNREAGIKIHEDRCIIVGET